MATAAAQGLQAIIARAKVSSVALAVQLRAPRCLHVAADVRCCCVPCGATNSGLCLRMNVPRGR